MKKHVGRPSPMHVKAICQPGKGSATCRYLTTDRFGWACVKTHPYAAAVVDSRISSGTMSAIGDNCAGVPEEITPGMRVVK